jgi:ABC-type branched-subunit amino acid transport system substrate-binding protein
VIEFNEAALQEAIIERVSDDILGNAEYLNTMVAKEVHKRIDAIFSASAEATIKAAVDEAVKSGFDREYQRVDAFGTRVGDKTSIRKQLQLMVETYWSVPVDPRNGTQQKDNYGSVTRAEYLMTQICANDFSDGLKHSVLSVTGALKDGLRNQLAKQMDAMLSDLFKVKSLQDQGKVEKPY